MEKNNGQNIEILVGQVSEHYDGVSIPRGEYVFGLIVRGEPCTIARYGANSNPEHILKEEAAKISKLLKFHKAHKSLNVLDYSLTNGQRLRMVNCRRVKCGSIAEKYMHGFQKALDSKLEE